MGKGIEYYYNDNILYDGECKNGNWSGIGYVFYKNGKILSITKSQVNRINLK